MRERTCAPNPNLLESMRSVGYDLNTAVADIIDNSIAANATKISILYFGQGVVPEFLRTLVFARPRGDDQFADCTFSPSLDMSR